MTDYKSGDIVGTFMVIGQPGELWTRRGLYPCICLRCRRRIQLGGTALDKTPNYCGHCKRILYGTWVNMLARCFDEENKAFDYYGGRGIGVCGEWQDFDNFRRDMGYRPCVGLTLDRVNNDGNYEPENCRWATVRQQIRNRRPRGPSRRAIGGQQATAEA